MTWGRLVAARSSEELGREGVLLLAAFSYVLLPGNPIRGRFPSKGLTLNPYSAQLPTFNVSNIHRGRKGN